MSQVIFNPQKLKSLLAQNTDVNLIIEMLDWTSQ